MLRIRNLLLFVIVSILVTGPVVPAAAQQDKSATIGHAVVIDAAGPIRATDLALVKAEAEFRQAMLAKERAYYAGNAARALSFYADDAVSIQPGMPDIVGKKALAETIEPFLAGYAVTSAELVVKEITFAGTTATRRAEWEETWTAKDGSGSFHQIGRCLLVWEKIDGKWQVVTELINYLEPPSDVAMDSE